MPRSASRPPIGVLDALRGTAWIARAPATAAALGSIALSAFMVLRLSKLSASNGGLGPDFIVFWSASRAQLGAATDVVYSPEAFHAFEQAVTGLQFGQIQPWLYPPHMLLVVYPLALLPFGTSLAVWLLATGSAYVASIAAIHRWRIASALAAAAFPPVAMNVLHGQNGFLTAALFGYALFALPSRPVVAGIAFGLLTAKPQLGVLVPFALVFGREWRAVASAVATTAILCVVATLHFGIETWTRALAAARWMQEVLGGPRLLTELQSPFAALRLAGASVQVALLGHGIVAATMIVVVAAVWRSAVELELKAAVLLSATALATPYFYDYDAMILAPAFAFIASHAARTAWLAWEPLTLFAVAPLLLWSKVVAIDTGVLPGPLCSLVVLALVMRRILRFASGHAPVAPARSLDGGTVK